jgi:hypothetical protein
MRTDRHDKANSRFSNFCEEAQKREGKYNFNQKFTSLQPTNQPTPLYRELVAQLIATQLVKNSQLLYAEPNVMFQNWIIS